MLYYIAYIFPSNLYEWEVVKCLTGLLEVWHSSIGEELYKNNDSRKNMYFYSHNYTIPTHTRFGTLVELSLLEYSSQEWIVTKLSTLECYRLKVRACIRNSLKATLGS